MGVLTLDFGGRCLWGRLLDVQFDERESIPTHNQREFIEEDLIN